MQRYRDIADRYTPAFIKVRYKRKRKGKLVVAPAHASINPPEMLVPKPETLEALVYYLHECAHFHLRHFTASETDNLRLRHLYTGGDTDNLAHQEYEAEVWTIATLRREGISVPASIIEDMRRYVSECLHAEDGRAPRRVRKFSAKRAKP